MEAIALLAFGAAPVAGGVAIGATGALAFTAPIAGTAGLLGFGGSATALGVIKGAFSIISAGFDIIGGFQKQDAFKEQAALEESRADQDRLEGLRAENDIREDALRQLAANNVRFGAAGLDITFGTPRTTQRKLRFDANRQTSINRTNTAIRARTRVLQAAQLRGQGSAAAASGVGSAIKGLLANA